MAKWPASWIGPLIPGSMMNASLCVPWGMGTLMSAVSSLWVKCCDQMVDC